MLRILINVPWFVMNKILLHNLNISIIKDESVAQTKIYRDRILTYPNVLTSLIIKPYY